jgi:hypothetical protein
MPRTPFSEGRGTRAGGRPPTLTATGLLKSLSKYERAAVDRRPDSDPAAALAVDALPARACESGAGFVRGHVMTGDLDRVIATWVTSTGCGAGLAGAAVRVGS